MTLDVSIFFFLSEKRPVSCASGSSSAREKRSQISGP